MKAAGIKGKIFSRKDCVTILEYWGSFGGELKIAYFDCSSGISGDMCLGALIGAGVPPAKLREELEKIPLGNLRLSMHKVGRAGLAAIKIAFTGEPGKGLKIHKWKDIEGIAEKSSISPKIKQKGLNVFRRLFEAESVVHGESFEEVHLHEAGSIDAVVDIFGTIIALSLLGVERVYSSPVNLGGGSVKTRSGILPVPPPAVSEIMKGVPVYARGVQCELTTPTGAAIIRELAEAYIDMPFIEIESVGTGAGSRDFPGWPNILRVFVGKALEDSAREKTALTGTVTIIETNIDDMNPQVFGYVTELLLKEGALDVFLTQIIMKKGRPGVMLTVLSTSENRDRLIEIIFRETTTIGLRYYEADRKVLSRRTRVLKKSVGTIRGKESSLNNNSRRTTPEYEDCVRIATEKGIPLIEVMKRFSK